MEWWGTTLVSVVSALTAGGFGAWLRGYLSERHDRLTKDHTQERSEEVENRKEVWERQAELITRLERQLAEVQSEQRRGLAGEMACRQRLARALVLIQWLYELLRQFHGHLGRLGADVGDLPALPEWAADDLRRAGEEDRREYAQRSLEHDTGLLRREAHAARAPAPPPAGPEGGGR